MRNEPAPTAAEKAAGTIAKLVRIAGHALAILAVSSVLSNASSQDAPTIERSMSLPLLGGTRPVAPTWSTDGESLAFLWNGEGRAFRDIWVTDASGSGPRRITNLAIGASPGADTTALQDASLQQLLVTAQSKRVAGVSEILWDATSSGLYFAFDGDIHHVSANSGDVLSRGTAISGFGDSVTTRSSRRRMSANRRSRVHHSDASTAWTTK